MSLKRKLYLEEKNAAERVNYLLEQLRQQEPYMTRKKNIIEYLKQVEAERKVQSELQKLRQQKFMEQQEAEDAKYKELSDIYSESSASYPPSSIAERYRNMSTNELFNEIKQGLLSHKDYDKTIRKRTVKSVKGSPRGSPSHENMTAFELSDTIKETIPRIEIQYQPNYLRNTTPNPLYKGGTRKRKGKRKKYRKTGKSNKKKSTRKK
uniref:Uncharacterized protein n=1 Tax=viral metagenome TaxID=1070528 RepID=A0A6C0AWV3_9ZZZZ|tara:strand:+ start:78564 stop:79187 length:624 start_codon:yes stop_codon:yes gene_type:complete